MKILFVSTDYKPALGGISEYTYQLALNFHNRGHQVFVLAPSMPECNDFDQEQPFATLRYRGSGLLTVVTLAYSMFRYARQLGVDVLYHATWYPPALVGSLMRPLLPGKQVIGVHGVETLHGGRTIRRRIKRFLLPLQRRTYNSASLIFAVSNFTRQRLVDMGVSPDKTRVIPNGVDITLGDPIDTTCDVRSEYHLEDRQILLTVARLAEHKGHATVIQAMPQVLAEAPNAIYVIVGQGETRHHLEELVSRLNLAEHVLFTGPVSDARRAAWLAACDIFVMPSQETLANVEGFGIAFLEAHAFGKPTIGGLSGGIPDVLVHEETGLLVNPDFPEETAQAIIRLLSSPNLAQILGQNGFRRVQEEFNWPKVVLRIEEALDIPSDRPLDTQWPTGQDSLDRERN